MDYKPYKDITIPKGYKPEERKAIAQDIIDFMVKRTLAGKKPSGASYPAYSKSYSKSLDFKIAGKSKDSVNLKLSSEMLNSIALRTHDSGKLRIGIEKGDTRNAKKAEGNELGTYGQKSRIPGKARPFLGINQKDKEKILKKYPLNDKNALLEAIARAKAAKEAAEKIVEDVAVG